MRCKPVLIRLIMALSMLAATVARAETVSNLRLWPAPDHIRLVFDVSGPVEHKVFTLQNPNRLVIDLADTSLKADLSQVDLGSSPVSNIRSGVREGNDLRVVLDLNRAVKTRSFLLKPSGEYGNRLVIDLITGEAPAANATADAKSPAKPAASTPVKQSGESAGRHRDIIVVVDAGHGGEDPGASGPGRIREKDVVLAIARELQELLKGQRGYKVRMTRSGDYYIGLRQRTKIARQNNADLFISVHADAYNRTDASGASVYALSQRGATSETARWLAEKENSSDLIGGVGGVSLDDKDEVLAGVLLDLSMTASLNASLRVGDHVLKSVGQVARLHKSKVEQAGFVVLKSPDIPSLLVETGFISNPVEAQRLNSQKYQQSIARSIYRGINGYFEDTPPPGTYLAWKKQGGRSPEVLADNDTAKSDPMLTRYVIGRGDTLSGIAERNNVSVTRLREINGLNNDLVRIGQVIHIPNS